MQPVTIHAGRTDVHGYSFNRLFRLRDGNEVFGRRGADAIREAGPIDPEVGVIGVWDKVGEFLGCVVNYACHGTTGPGGASADCPVKRASRLRNGSLTVTSVGLNTTGNNVRATTGSNFSSF